MPHIVLEHSSNLFEKHEITKVFHQIHAFLSEALPTNLANCKSRAYECKTCNIGNGDPKNAFVHLTLKILPGRPDGVLQALGKRLMDLLSVSFPHSMADLNLDITLEICELSTAYFKNER